jgi:N-ethylmaleimide reductase
MQVSFGRPFISNPDLPERFANNWPLAPDPESETYYRGGAKGYIDWPTYTPPASK